MIMSLFFFFFFFFKQKTAYEMRISDWSSDVSLPIFPPQPFAPVLDHRPDPGRLGRIVSVRRHDLLLPVGWLSQRTLDRRRIRHRRPRNVRSPSGRLGGAQAVEENGRAHVCTPVTKAHLVCRLLHENKKTTYTMKHSNYFTYTPLLT